MVCMHIRIYVRMYVCMYVCMHVIYVYMYVYMYVYVCRYALDHDERIKLPHYQHHKVFLSNYFVYMDIQMPTVRDDMRTLIKRNA